MDSDDGNGAVENSGAPAMDILFFGEPMYEFSLVDADTVLPGIGGDVSNAAIAAARAGARVGMLTRLGTDLFANRIRELYRDEGIDVRWVEIDPDAPTGIYFIEYGPGGHRFSYRRAGSAASRTGPENLQPAMFENAKVLHLSGITQAISTSSLAATLRAAELARDAGCKVSFDTNLRLNLWSGDTARQALNAILPMLDYVFPSLEDAEALLGLRDPREICDFFLEAGAQFVVLTLGADGAVVGTRDGLHQIAPFPANAVDATAAGDTFDGAFLAEFLRSADPVFAARFACAAASMAVEREGAVRSIPRLDDIQAKLKS